MRNVPPIRDEAAVQANAVHRRAHAEFADAIVDVAAGEIAGRERRHALGEREIGLRQVGRAAERDRDCGVDDFERHFRRFAASRRSACWRRGRPCTRPCACEVRRESRSQSARRNSSRLAWRGEPRFPGLAHPARARAGGAPGGEAIGGNFERRIGPAEVLRASPRLRRRRAPSRAPLRCPPWSARRSRSSCWQAIIVGPVCALASSSAASIAAGSWPSMAIVCQPAASKRSSWLSLVASEVAPSIVMLVVVPHEDQLGERRDARPDRSPRG